MRKFFSCFCVTLVAQFAMHSLTFAGAWSSAGGNAVVCFPDRTVAGWVRDLITRRQAIPPRAISLVRSVVTLDLWNAIGGNRLPSGAPDLSGIYSRRRDESTAVYIDRIVGRAQHWIPVLGEMIQTSRSVFPMDRVENQQANGVIDQDDAAMVYDVPANCIRLTIAVQGSFSGSQSLTPFAQAPGFGYIPGESGARLNFDTRFFQHSRHGRTSAAILRMHEDFAFFGRTNGSRDTSATQLLIESLISVRASRVGDIARLLYDSRMVLPLDAQNNATSAMSYLDLIQLPNQVRDVLDGLIPHAIAINLLKQKSILKQLVRPLRLPSDSVCTTFTQELDNISTGLSSQVWIEHFARSLARSITSCRQAAAELAQNSQINSTHVSPTHELTAISNARHVSASRAQEFLSALLRSGLQGIPANTQEQMVRLENQGRPVSVPVSLQSPYWISNPGSLSLINQLTQNLFNSEQLSELSIAERENFKQAIRGAQEILTLLEVTVSEDPQVRPHRFSFPANLNDRSQSHMVSGDLSMAQTLLRRWVITQAGIESRSIAAVSDQ